MDIRTLALQGMTAAQERVERSAARLAALGDPTDAVDLSAEMAAMIESEIQFAASVKAFRAGEQIDRSTLNLLA